MVITAEKARQILADAPHDKVFWLSNGHSLKNLKELRNALTTISPDVFNHHVNVGKNDFANWIRAIAKDSDLADELVKTRTQHLTLLKVNARVRELESIVAPKITRISLSSPVKVNISRSKSKRSKPKKSAKSRKKKRR